jgi:hypothetical protein
MKNLWRGNYVVLQGLLRRPSLIYMRFILPMNRDQKDKVEGLLATTLIRPSPLCVRRGELKG